MAARVLGELPSGETENGTANAMPITGTGVGTVE